jgi:endonuclease YncB( thermonuclease family)
VERVVDGDTIRARHLPGYSWRRWKHPSPLATRGIADQTLSVRLYGIDCPELAKFGKPSQPYGPEAKEHTSRLVLHRVVKVTLLRKDQYRRAVARVETVPSRLFSWVPLEVFRPKDLSVSLAAAGLAELYAGGGAEYCVRTVSQWTRITLSARSFIPGNSLPIFSAPTEQPRRARETDRPGQAQGERDVGPGGPARVGRRLQARKKRGAAEGAVGGDCVGNPATILPVGAAPTDESPRRGRDRARDWGVSVCRDRTTGTFLVRPAYKMWPNSSHRIAAHGNRQVQRHTHAACYSYVAR